MGISICMAMLIISLKKSDLLSYCSEYGIGNKPNVFILIEAN